MTKPHKLSLALTAVLVVTVTACTSKKKAGDTDKAPLGQLAEIAVEVDGKPAAALTGKRLAELKPDFGAGAQRGWKVTTLLGASLTPDRRLEIIGENKVRVIHSKPTGARRGKVLALIVGVGAPFIGRVDPQTPFAEPARRRIDRIAKLKVYQFTKPMPGKRKPKTDALEVRIEIAGGKTVIWKYAELKKVTQVTGQANHWSLREIAKAFGKDARITALETRKGKKYVVPPAEWNDAKRLPMIKLNRRGQLKFWWSRADNPRKREGGNLRDVTIIRVATSLTK